MSTLAERIEWILNNRYQPDGQPWTDKDLSVAADIGPSHVGQMRRGTIKNPRNKTLMAIAAVARVSPTWLITGQGMPEATELEAPVDEPPDLEVHVGEVVDVDRLGNLSYWPMLLKGAKAERPHLPPWVWARLEYSRPHLTGDYNVAKLIAYADDVAKHDPPPPEGVDPRQYWAKLLGVKTKKINEAMAAASKAARSTVAENDD